MIYKDKMAGRLLGVLLAVAMVFTGMFTPMWGAMPAFAGEAAGSVTICGSTDYFAEISAFASDADGTVSDTAQNLLASVTPEKEDWWGGDISYTADLTEGYYLLKGKDEGGHYLGGAVVNVTSETSSIRLCAVADIKASNSGWTRGTDYDVTVTAKDEENNPRKVLTSEGTEGKLSCLVVSGDSLTAVFTPKDNHPGASQTSKTEKINYDKDSFSAKIEETARVTVTAPAGSTIDMGKAQGKNYYSYEFFSAEETKTQGGKITADFKVPVNSDVFYRISNPEGVTYWKFITVTEATSVEVTSEDLHIEDGSFRKNTVDRSFTNKYDLGSIYMGANAEGCKYLNPGDKFELNCFRNQIAVENLSVTINLQASQKAKIALPDMHYEVVDFNGNPSDLVTVTPSEKNSSVAEIKAGSNPGTAVVLVTYDAMTFVNGADGEKFSAIWPEFTGVLVVSVGNDGSSLDTGMTLERIGAHEDEPQTGALDAEHDILFFTGAEGATYSFAPEAGCSVSVARPEISDGKLSYSGFSTYGISETEGKITIKGLKEGRNIIKVEKGGDAAYQVITARKVSYTLEDAEGNAYTDSRKPKAGDTVVVKFTGLVAPAEMLPGVYAFNTAMVYRDDAGNLFKSNNGVYDVTDFSGNSHWHKIEITIPKYFTGDTYSLDGVMRIGGKDGKIGSHREVTYKNGVPSYFRTADIGRTVSCMPELNIALAGTNWINAKVKFVDEKGQAVDMSKLDVKVTDAAGGLHQVAADGSFKALADTFECAVSGEGYGGKTETIQVTADGNNVFTITLKKLPEGAWNGKTKTKPAEESGIFQIKTGAELAWFVDQCNIDDEDDRYVDDLTLKAKLVNDIELGSYPWVAKENYGNNKIIFDGNGKTVSGLNVTGANGGFTGLFARIGKDSYIHDLTVKGESQGPAGIVGFMYRDSKAENCVNYVNVDITDNDEGGAGGIAGKALEGAVIKRCVNYGTIKGDLAVGGILGRFSGAATVEECVNRGEIKCKGVYAGGIFGECGVEYNGEGATVRNCYNAGNVSGGSFAGGIGGKVQGSEGDIFYGDPAMPATVENCYTSGRITGAGTYQAFGKIHEETVVLTNNAYIGATGPSDKNALRLTAEELKNHNFGKAYALTCQGYPALTWETGIQKHEAAGAATVVAPGCTTEGYSQYTCRHCGKTYKEEIKEALGHEKGADFAEDAIKSTYTCGRCHNVVTEWKDERYAHLGIGAPQVVNIHFTDDEQYGWKWNSKTSRIESTNKYYDSTAKTVMSFDLKTKGYFSFDYGVSSEEYDKATFVMKKDGQAFKTIAEGIGGTVSGGLAEVLEPGTYSIEMSYAKDDEDDGGEDAGYIGNFKFKAENGVKTEKVNVSLSGSGMDIAKMSVSVTNVIAGEYGYPVSKADAPSVLDLLVAVHKSIYGDKFTAETAKDYLEVKNGYISKAFGKAAGGSGFMVNHQFPADEYGNGYAADEARLNTGDTVDFWFYQDLKNWKDFYCYFVKQQAEAKSGEKISLELKGFTAMDSMTGSGAEAQPVAPEKASFEYTLINNATGMEKKVDGAVAAGGKVSISAPEAGEYTLRVTGTYDGKPVVSPWCIITVTGGSKNSSGSGGKKSSGSSGSASETRSAAGSVETPKTAAPVENKVSERTDAAGNKAVVTTEASGKKSATVEVSAEAVKGAAEGKTPILLPISTITPQTQTGKADSVKVVMPQGVAKAAIRVPVAAADETTVLMKVGTDGGMTPVPLAVATADGTGLIATVGDGEYLVVNNKTEFVDVTEGDWFGKGALFAAARNLMIGVGEGKFNQAGQLTLAQTAAVIGRLEGEGTSESWNKAVAKYGATENSSRERTIAMLCDAYKALGGTVTVSASDEAKLSAYADNAAISPEYREAVLWAIDMGLIKGMDDTHIDPQGKLTRGQFGTMLERLVELLNNAK